MPRLRPRSFLIAVLSLVLLAGAGAPAIAQDATPTAGEVTVLGPEESYAGVTRGEWSARWFQWTGSLPPAINPTFNPTGEHCGYGQSGPVFFLPGNFTGESGTITCVVPEGMAIFVLIGGGECSSVEPPPYFGRDEEELGACAAVDADALTDLQASINGEEVPDLETYRTTSPLFPLTFPEDNIYGVPAGVALAVFDAYTFIITPPPPGEYEIVVSAAFGEGADPFTIPYRVIVEAPQVIEPEATPVASPEAATPVA
jgi:hypothetical protein